MEPVLFIYASSDLNAIMLCLIWQNDSSHFPSDLTFPFMERELQIRAIISREKKSTRSHPILLAICIAYGGSVCREIHHPLDLPLLAAKPYQRVLVILVSTMPRALAYLHEVIERFSCLDLELELKGFAVGGPPLHIVRTTGAAVIRDFLHQKQRYLFQGCLISLALLISCEFRAVLLASCI